MRKATFCVLIDGLLQGERWHIGCPPLSSLRTGA